MNDKHESPSKIAKSLRDVSPYLGLGSQLAATIIIMFFIGYWLDNELGWLPILTIVFSFIGGFAAIYNFIKTVLNLNEKKKSENRR
jgi:F0F1-type ATP synthase assembly protein I